MSLVEKDFLKCIDSEYLDQALGVHPVEDGSDLQTLRVCMMHNLNLPRI